MKQHHLTDEQSLHYCEGQLSAAEKVAVEAHLTACAECRRDIEIMQEATTAFEHQDWGDLPPLPRELVDAAVAHALAQFQPLLVQLNAALWSKMQQLCKHFVRHVVPPPARPVGIGVAKDRRTLHILSDSFQVPATNLTVRLAMSEAQTTLVIEGDIESLRGAQVVGFVRDTGEVARRRVLGVIGETGVATLATSEVLALERLAVVPPV